MKNIFRMKDISIKLLDDVELKVGEITFEVEMTPEQLEQMMSIAQKTLESLPMDFGGELDSPLDRELMNKF